MFVLLVAAAFFVFFPILRLVDTHRDTLECNLPLKCKSFDKNYVWLKQTPPNTISAKSFEIRVEKGLATAFQSSLLWVVSTDTALLAWLHDKGLHPLEVANYPVLGCGILHHTRITVNLDPICKLRGSARDRATVLVTPDCEFTIASSAMREDSIS